jgi:RHS repeat-associated protein
VRKDENTVLPGVVCSLYTAEGEPLNRSVTTDGSGVASFAVEAGTYMVQARYLGYDFTLDAIETPTVLSASLTIPHRDLAIRLVKDQGAGAEPVSGLRCYLYSMDEGEGLSAIGLHADSDDQGMVHFVVPEERAYYGVATLFGREFISVESESQATLTIELGTMTVTVRDDSRVTEANPDGRVEGAVVALHTSEGTALGQELRTGSDGQVCFTLPEGNYKLRVGYNDQQFWSGVINTSALGNTPVEMVNGSGGLLSRLHDPHPSLWHGTPPEYWPLLALASGSLSGMLTSTSTPIATTPQVVYYLNDHLGTAQLLVNAAGTVIWQGDTQPFGQVTEVINQIDHRFRFPGQMVDHESGLYYNWNRFYDPSTGRYLSADPIGLQGGMNLYAYVVENPVNAVDPTGLSTFMCTKPLHGLGPKWGPLLYPKSKFNPSPAYHQFLCVNDDANSPECGGMDRSGSALWSKGIPSSDTWPTKPEEGQCEPVDLRKCVDDCVLKAIRSPTRPGYGIGPQRDPGDCQEWGDNVIKQCQKKCEGK